MTNIEMFLVGASVFAFLVFLANILVKNNYSKLVKKITKELEMINPDFKIKSYKRDDVFQFEINNIDYKIYIKLVKSRSEYEFIITNSNKWIVNQSPQQWTRKTKPIFIEKSKEFSDFMIESTTYKKVVLIYPSCKRIIRYLNESDTVIVKEDQAFNRVNFIRYENLKEFMKNQ